MFTFLAIALLAQQGAAPLPELRVAVTASVYHPDGTVTSETTTIGDPSPSVRFVFSRRSLCDSAPAAAAEPADAGFGWRVASHVVRQSASQAVLSVDWRRVWDRGRKVANGPSGTVQLTLAPGDRIPLDHIPNAGPDDRCRAVGLGLDVRLGRAASLPRTVAEPLPAGARAGGAGSLDVDLWLVHTTPSGTEQAQHQSVRLTPGGGMFAFAPIRFETTRGEIGVELTGALQRFTAGGGELLLVSMSRVITGRNTPAAGIGGSSSSLIAMPGPDEVLSFEMTTAGGGFGGGGRGGRGSGRGGAIAARGPETPGSGGAGRRGSGSAAARGILVLPNTAAGSPVSQAAVLLDGHRFALRVKVTPVPGM